MITQEQATKIYYLLKAKPGIRMFFIYCREYDSSLNFCFHNCAYEGHKICADCKITPNGDGTYSIRVWKTLNMVEGILIKELHGIKENDLRDTLDKIKTGELVSDNVYMRDRKVVGMSRDE